MVNLPRHIGMTIEHNPHKLDYESVEDWIEGARVQDLFGFDESDIAEMKRTGEVWCMRWYPDTPIGWCGVVAATLERMLELANR